MKLTIERVYEKFIGRTDMFPEHFEDFTADIQAYVKQEMIRELSNYEAKLLVIFATRMGLRTNVFEETKRILEKSKIATIENYGKEDGG